MKIAEVDDVERTQGISSRKVEDLAQDSNTTCGYRKSKPSCFLLRQESEARTYPPMKEPKLALVALEQFEIQELTRWWTDDLLDLV